VQSKGKAVLIPEVVKRNGTEVGRFEVTRAQYATFDKNYKMPPGTEDYPANGIALEKAKAYIEWLSKITGQSWRLPTETEFSALYEKRERENTLDYWAGYALNPDDTIRLREKAKELPGTAPLLKPVGDFTAEGAETDEPVFDFGGNVGEWVETNDGKGKGAGGSADCPADTRSSCTPAPEYIGFRVVRDSPATAAPAAASAK
jgi:formylglycine-generating enzyme required for sulfatase activity